MASSFTSLLLTWCLLLPVAQAVETKDLPLNADTEVSVQQYHGNDDRLLLWLPSEAGFLPREHESARQIASSGTSVWMADLLSAYFLPTLSSSIEQIPATDVANLIETVRQRTGKRIYLIANSRGALLALRGAHAWQQQQPDVQLGGVILISPQLFVKTPEPGQAGEFMPVVNQTNLPIFMIQPANSPWRWKIERTLTALEQSGSDVYVRILEGVRDRFYYRPDATQQEDRLARNLPEYLQQAVRLLQAYNDEPRSPGKAATKTPAATVGKQERNLRPYRGDPRPPELRLKNLEDEIIDLQQLKGQVVLVNFWASWCPPCVHEMPSMQQLANDFKDKPFKILAVNMAEDRATVEKFLREKVNVDFPILFDSDGRALQRWKVFAFPTSYVIGKQGKIRLALFGAIDWTQEDVIKKISALLKE